MESFRQLNVRDRLQKFTILGVLVLVSFLTICAFVSLVLKGTNYDGVSIYILLIMSSWCGLMFWFYRKECGSLAVTGINLLLIGGASFGAVSWGMTLEMAMLTFALVIIISFLTLSRTDAILTTILTFLTFSFLWYLQVEGHIAQNQSWKVELDHLDGIEFLVFLAFFAVLAFVARREIQNALTDADQFETDLLAEKSRLEETVIVRTEELRKKQAEELFILYRFVEFGKLSAGLFHDLINPLTALSISLHQLSASKDGSTDPGKPSNMDPARQVELAHIKTALGASIQLGKLIEQTKSVLKLEKEEKPFVVAKEIDQLMGIFQFRARKENYSLSFVHAHSPELSLIGSPARFNQVIMNLLSNACDAVEEKITKNKITEGEEVTVLSSVTDGTLNISVKDSGIGIPADKLPNIFTHFFTTKNTAEHREQGRSGTGIGLSQAKEIIEKDFKGKLTVRTQGGKGSEFIVSIPLGK
jgi:signal transduction histidine kinase